MNEAARSGAPVTPTFGDALRYWALLGCTNFGGPAGQIALMQQELVERRRWIGQAHFMHALNYCMLLPGPEAMQLATYIGWLWHGTWGGVVAGVLFVLPGALLMLALTLVYHVYGDVAWIAGVFYGLGPAVVAIVAAAVLRVGTKTLRQRALLATAAIAFAAITAGVAFPAIVLGAALLGYLGAQHRPQWFAPITHGVADGAIDAPAAPPLRRTLSVLLTHLALWAAPFAVLGATRGFDDHLVAIGAFFSIAAMVTFGGAYAVLAFVAQAAVERYGWLSTHDMTVGLGLAESTPGPLILVVQFVGFLAGANHPPPGGSAIVEGTLAAVLTLWVTFVPCFLWVLLGAPFVERLRGRRRLDGALTAVTAAVVGVILHLAVWLAWRVLVIDGTRVDLVAAGLAVAGFVAIRQWRRSIIEVVVASAVVGMLVRLFA